MRGEVSRRRAFDPRAVGGEARAVQGAIPRTLDVVPREYAAEMRADAADAAGGPSTVETAVG
jgi:hypothetical protein